jgi:hypothetical protein
LFLKHQNAFVQDESGEADSIELLHTEVPKFRKLKFLRLSHDVIKVTLEDLRHLHAEEEEEDLGTEFLTFLNKALINFDQQTDPLGVPLDELLEVTEVVRLVEED